MTDTSQGAAPQKSGGGVLKFVLLGCAGCACLFFALIGAAIGIPFMVTAPAVDAARGHLTLSASDPGRSYAECSSGFKASTSEADFKAFVAAHPEFYAAPDITFSNRAFENGVVRLTGTTAKADGSSSAPILVELVKEGETWRVQFVGPPR